MGNKIGRRRQVVDEKYTRPQGLYHHREIDEKKLRKLILESKLAPCYPGSEECALDLEECPICFLNYPSLNRSRCCMKGICTECFLQMKPPHATRPTECPFCKTLNYAVEYRGVKTKEEKGLEEVEEQKFIEAQIRMRQQEIQDEAERLKKRKDISSSSRIMNDTEVEYCDIVPSLRCTTQINDLVSSQASCSLPAGMLPSHCRQNRADNFDRDLDDIMVMEAIWLSIQEHGHQGYPVYLGSFFPGPSFLEECYSSHGIAPPEVSPYSGLACAASALNEHQQIYVESSANISSSATSMLDMLHQSGSLGNMRFMQNNPSSYWTEIPPDSGRDVLREGLGECSTHHWSDMSEAGTSYAGSDVMVDPRTAVIPFPSGAIMTPGHFAPENFEEQMILAMSVSLADTRARMPAQGLTWLGQRRKPTHGCVSKVEEGRGASERERDCEGLTQEKLGESWEDAPDLILLRAKMPLQRDLITLLCHIQELWNEAAKKKARISILAQLAAEEAFQVEAMASASVLPVSPSSRTGFHECARCLAPATTRCSRCKSVRYCSGKCQIIHWRQGHKHECQLWHDSSLDVLAGLPLKDTVQHKPILNNSKSSYLCNGIEEPLHYNIQNDMDDPSFISTDTSEDSETGRKPSGIGVVNKSKKDKSYGNDYTACAFDQDHDHDACAQALLTNHFTEISSEDAPKGSKLTNGNYTASPCQIHMNQETNISSNARNPMVQHNKSAGEARKGLEQSGSTATSSRLHLDKHVISECQNVANISPEKADCSESGFSSSNGKSHVSYPAEHYSAKESIMYRKPPYTLGQTASSSQKLAETMWRGYHSQGLEKICDKENGSGIRQKNIFSDIHMRDLSGNASIEGMMAVSKKNPKALKRNLLLLLNDNKKNKVCQMLFPYEDLVKFFQCEEWRISPRGLLNCGNSCYANAVLQCLTGTKPLMVYLLQRSHSRTCCVKEWCLMCELEQHVSMLKEGGGPLSANKILLNMRNIGCRMGGGNQEDAHEFLRLLVMSMQSVCLEGLGGEKEVDPRLQETTLIQQIFGGRLKSKVKCLRCHLESERYESIMDLTLEIHGWVESLEDALTQFTAPEDLDGENMYRCGRCLAYVKARKQLSLHEVPNILTIVLKRFQTGKYGKINKCVTFSEMLDMIPFVTGTADNPPLYLLYAVVVHVDTLNASFSGHYISYVKDLEGTWFRIDDSEVQAVPPNQVMSEGAYMLFYSRSFPRPPQAHTEKKLSHPPTFAKRSMVKSQKSSKHGQQRQDGSLHASENLVNLRNHMGKEHGEDTTDQAAPHISRPSSRNSLPDGTYPDTSSMEFSDATSSDWHLFTSSDDSSFTTESTRDSFSTADYGDNTSIDTISSIFNPFYAPGYVHNNAVPCTKFPPCRPQTRFFMDSTSGSLVANSAIRRCT
ncbi:hypothetical protein OPV22_015623 [Ensete ventricosum]|uniref:ubiquitinyl hydrolase 1 n=2 Tax=Ensete ventricosum TaxID=4639 RepID=A0AAV8RE40_ENSVE|nr:hypothetical protein OPV22_015623 [Ensete ventricosum]